jgi:hypothetical protein
MTVEERQNEDRKQDRPQPGPNVTVTVDTHVRTVRRGSWSVAEFKKEVGVDASRALDEVFAGEFRPLADDGRITIKGGEIFVSHARQGASS